MADPIVHTDSTGTVILSPTGTGFKLKDGGLSLDNSTLVAGSLTGATITAPVTGGTISSNINTDIKVLAASQTIDASTTPAALSTPFSWTVVAGKTYVFDVELNTTMTTNAGLGVAFALTTATLTSIRYNSYATTATDNGTAVSTTGTTAASGTLMFNSKTAAYTRVRLWGSFVVNAGGTFEFKVAQETSGTGGDVTIVLIGSQGRLERVL